MTEEEKTAYIERDAIQLGFELLRLAGETIPSDNKSPDVIRNAQQQYCEFATEKGWVIVQGLLQALNRRDPDLFQRMGWQMGNAG